MSSLQNPARGSVNVDISGGDQTIIPAARGLWVGGAGDVMVRLLDGSTPTFVGVPAGTLLPIQFDLVDDGSTATDMVALR